MQAKSEITDQQAAPAPRTERELRWMADAYEQAQKVRVQTGERIRAVVQSRDDAGSPATEARDADEVLQEIRTGRGDGPVPLLGRTYRRHWEAEQEMAQAMQRALQTHPAWPWLAQIRGIGPTLAGKLLARLDASRADTPSAFWAYCGLATVPGVEYRCSVCSYTVAHPASYHVKGAHNRLGSRRACTGMLEATRREGVRVAQPKPGRGQRSTYDQAAKKVCYLIGTSFLKAGGKYALHYRAERKRLESDRPGWAPARQHLAALRKTEKLFLSHLWLIWRTALELPLTEPYAQEADSSIDPWEMVDRPAAAAREDAAAGPRRYVKGASATGPGPRSPRPRSTRRPAPRQTAARSREGEPNHLRLES